MPYTGPRVLPTGLSPLAESLDRFGTGYGQGVDQREKRKSDRLTRLLAEANLARLGVVPEGATGTEPPPGVTPPTGPDLTTARPAAPPPISGALPGSPDYRAGSPSAVGASAGPTLDDPNALASVFASMQGMGRPAPAPKPGAWTPAGGFAGVPTSRFTKPIPLEPGYVLDPSRSPEELALGRSEREYEMRRGFETTLADNQRQITGQRNFAALRAIAPTHPLIAAGYNPNLADQYGAEITQARTEQAQRDKEVRDGQAAYNLIRQINPRHPLVQSPFDPGNPTKYSAAVSLVGGQQTREETRQDKGEAAYAALQADFPDHPLAKEKFDATNPGKYDLVYQKAKATSTKVGQIAPLALTNFARFKAAVPTMEKQHEIMVPFEEKVRHDPAAFDGMDQFQAAFYKQPGTFSVTHAAEAAIAQAHLDSANPELARYLRAGARWALEDMSIQQRGGSEARMAFDQFVSQIGPGMDDASITDTQEGRSSRLNGYKEVLPAVDAMLGRATAGAGGGGGGAPAPKVHPPQSQDEYDHLISIGMNDAAIVKKYGEPAAGIRRQR